MQTDDVSNNQRLSNKELLVQNIDYAVNLALIYLISLSIFPGFLYENTGQHGLGSWYALVLVAVNITGPSSMKNEEVMGPRQQVKPTALQSKTPTAKSAKRKDNASSATDKQSTNSVIKVQNRYGLLSDNES